MKRLSLVAKFQKELDVPKGEAIFRVIMFLLLLACFVAVVVLIFVYFPYTGTFTQKVPLLPGDHVEVKKILDGEVLLSRDQFLKKAKGNKVFVAFEDGTERINKSIIYMTKTEGMTYRYDQPLPNIGICDRVASRSFKNGMAFRKISRDVVFVIVIFIIMPLLILVILLLLIHSTQRKKKGYCEYDYVW